MMRFPTDSMDHALIITDDECGIYSLMERSLLLRQKWLLVDDHFEVRWQLIDLGKRGWHQFGGAIDFMKIQKLPKTIGSVARIFCYVCMDSFCEFLGSRALRF